MIYMFVSKRDALVYAFTDNPKGSSLPPEFAPWHPLGAQALSGAGGIDSAEVIRAAISAKEYYVVRHDPPRDQSQ